MQKDYDKLIDEILESYKDEDNKEVDAEKKVDEILKELDDNNVVNSQQNITENKEDLTTETPEVKPNNSSNDVTDKPEDENNEDTNQNNEEVEKEKEVTTETPKVTPANTTNDVTDKPEKIEDEDYIAAKDFVNDILYNQPTEEEIKFNEFKQKVENMLKRDIDLDKLSVKKNRELDKELKKLEDDIELDDFGKYTDEEYQKIARQLKLDKKTPEEIANMTQEELDKIVNDILNEDVDLDEFTEKENEEIEQELKNLEAEIKKEATPEIEETQTNPQTPNTSFVQDEAPINDQEDIVVDPNKNSKFVLAVTDVNELLAGDIELQNLYPNQQEQDKTKDKTKGKPEDKKDNTKEEVKEAPKPLSDLDKSLNDVSRSSGLNLKTYFIEDNKKEIEALKKSGNLKTFEFNGDLKSFYTETYRYVLESNMIARQIDPDNKSLPDIAKLTEKFEVFMKNVGQELIDRNQIDSYVPFGGLTAHEIRQIQKDVLMNRPQTKEEALQINASKLGGKNYEEKIENAYKFAHNTIEANFGKDYKLGLDPKMDEKKLANAVDAIKGAIIIDENKKLWETYKPKFSAPDFKKPVWRHPITNTFKLIGKGISIALDCSVKFPLVNLYRGIMYAFEKPIAAISRNNNIQKLEEALMAKGFKRAQVREKLRETNSKVLDVEKDSKNIDKQFEKNLKTIKEYNETKEKNKSVEKTTVNEVQTPKQDLEVNNPNKTPMVIQECATVMYEGTLTPKIEDKTLVKTNDLKI
jgi:hypothetical protein